VNEKLQIYVVRIRLMTNIGTFAFSQRFLVNEISWTERHSSFFEFGSRQFQAVAKSSHQKSGQSQRWPLQKGYDNMRFGSVLFWLAMVLAVLILLWAVLDFLFGLSGRFPVIDVTALEFAAVIWLIGFFCRRAF
jgi:hypothetical protein